MSSIAQLILRIESICAELIQLSKKQYFRNLLKHSMKPLATGGFATVYAISDEWVLRQPEVGSDLPEVQLSVSRHSGFTSPTIHRASDGREIQAHRGQDLMYFLEEEGPPAFRDQLKLVGQTLEAVYQLHKAGWIHGDLKPENILVKRQGREDTDNPFNGFRVTLCDCEGAIHCEDLEGDFAAPSFFTSLYMPPEALQNGGSIEVGYLPKWDAYSLGVVFLSLCFSDLAPAYLAPRESLTSRDIFSKRLSVIRDRLDLQKSTLADYEQEDKIGSSPLQRKLWRLVMGLLEVDPEMRLSVAAARVDFADLLKAYNLVHLGEEVELLHYAANDRLYTNSDVLHLLYYLKNHLQAWQSRQDFQKSRLFSMDLSEHLQKHRQALHLLYEAGLDEATLLLYQHHFEELTLLRRRLYAILLDLYELFPPLVEARALDVATGAA